MLRRIVIAGGGVAALETLLALRAAPRGPDLDVAVLAPGEHLLYRPLSVLEPFGGEPVRRYALAGVCADHDARLVGDALAAVDGDAQAVVTESGERLPYDALVIATGARRHAALEHVSTFFGDQDAAGVRSLARDVQDGSARSIAFVVPPGAGWSLPLYELALLTARHAASAGVDVALTLITPEDTPLAIFGGAGSEAVARLLDDAGVAVLTSAYASGYDGRRVHLVPGATSAVAVDRVVALPVLRGPAIDGLPNDPDGFVRTDEHRRVPGLPGVFAIGDATTFPVKQGGLASQHADLVASLIARRAGPDPATRPRLRAILLTGGAPLYLQATIAGGRSVASSASADCPWWPPHKIAARYLAPYLADRAPVASALAACSAA